MNSALNRNRSLYRSNRVTIKKTEPSSSNIQHKAQETLLQDHRKEYAGPGMGD